MRQQSVFEMWMRTGLWPEPDLEQAEEKFNPWHDPDDGRFAFANQGEFFGRGSHPTPSPSPAARPSAAAPSHRTARPGPVTRGLQAAQEVVRESFKQHVLPFENDRAVVYKDSLGNLTVGIGHLVTRADNLKEGDSITPARKEALWRTDADRALTAAETQMRLARISERSFLQPLASVDFQLNGDWYKKHKDTWALIMNRQYAAAAREAEDSRWFGQTPKRVRAFQQALMRLERAEQARGNAKRDSGARTP